MKRVLFCLAVATTLVFGQQNPEAAGRLPADPQVRRALEFVQQNEPWVIEQQIRLTEIAAPPFKEATRAQAYKQAFEELGLKNVRIDKEGNVLGERPGRQPRPHLVLAAHLDTVFPEGTDVRVKRDGALLKAPGIADDGRGLAVVLGVIRALQQTGLETEGSITFVGNVGEEGLGDLRGVKHLFDQELKDRMDRFISVDGVGLSIVNVGVGSYRYRVTYSGPGGHSFGAFGMTNPIHALGRLIAKISEFEVPASPKVTFNVGRISGGTSVNAIAPTATAEVDMRSSDVAALETVHEKFKRAAEQALSDEKERWKNNGLLAVKTELLGFRPAGRTVQSAPITQAVLAVTRAIDPAAGALREGSTDANVGMSRGVPALTIGGGGRATGGHSPGETYDPTDSWKGTQRVLLVALALTQP